MSKSIGFLCFSLAVMSSINIGALADNDLLDLSQAVIIPNSQSHQADKAAELLRTEILRRSGIDMPVLIKMPVANLPRIVLDLAQELPPEVQIAASLKPMLSTPEGYAIWVTLGEGKQPTVHVVGSDKRGVLFGAGRLIRLLRITTNKVLLASDIALASTPKYPMRGHQLGYRNTANTYDAWDLATFEQYIRDLVLFGTNSIELIPTLDPQEFQGRLMKRSIWEMNVLLSQMIGDYGLDVWLWLPLDEDVTNPKEAQSALEKRRILFESCPYIAHVMVPGGDPGHTPPDILMPWMAKLAEVLHAVHPDAGLWVSNQGFDHDQNEWFFRYLQEQKPSWLKGVVYGPWTKMSLEEQRKRIPEQFQLRRYPDITHTLRCQYPIPEWDRAFALTLSREPVCPRPFEMVNIHNIEAPFAEGFVSYSDGSHDDFNKIAFSMAGWDPTVSPETIVQEYSKVFFGDDLAEDAARGILLLDRSWRGPIEENNAIEESRSLWEGIAARAGKRFLDNWRMQMFVYRATYDSFLKSKKAFDEEQEKRILEAIAEALPKGATAAIKAGLEAIKTSKDTPYPVDIHARVYRLNELGLMLMKTIGYQLSVKPPYYAPNPERSGSLDFTDLPLNNSLWLEKQLNDLAELEEEPQKLERITRLIQWENPGKDGFYDDLGNLTKQPHLVRQTIWKDDPGFVHGPQEEFSKAMDNATLQYETARLSWLDQAQTLYGTPLKMRYTNLAKDAQYRVRITYAGRFKASLELWADGQYKVHDALPQPDPVWPVEFDVPIGATQDGILELEWRLASGRGCQVAEVWLIKK